METIEAIMTRRSIRQYKPDPVDETTLEKILEAARWAPSWGNQQPCRFVLVTNQKIKDELADMVGKNPATNAIRTAPIIIVACAKIGISGYYDGKEMSDEGDWHMYDIAVAMQNIVLAAHALGLGAVHVGLNFDTKRAAAILDVPEGFRPIVMSPLGYPAHEGKAPPRKELNEIIFAEKFGAAR